MPALLPRRSKGMAAALLVLLLAAASAASLAEARYKAVDVHLAFNICTEPYHKLYDMLHLHPATGDNTPRMVVGGHRYLPSKDADAEERSPSASTILHLAGCSDEELHLGCSDEDHIMLVLLDIDGGVLAFTNSTGLWHAFLFSNSTTLGHRNL